jgi:hypothetical protein
MGAEISSFAFELLADNEKMVMPFPSEFYNPLRVWTVTKKRKRDDRVDAFVEFVNSPSRIMGVYDWAYKPYEFVDTVCAHFNEMDVFQQFWKEKCGSPYSEETRILLIENGRVDPEPRGKYRIQHDVKFIQSSIFSAMEHGNPCFIPMYLHLRDHNGSHANMSVLKYDPGFQQLSCVIFEPHATKDAAPATIHAMREFLTDTVLMALEGAPRVYVWSPWVETGLQGDAPVCLQWSLLMYFTYMVNCELGGGRCGRKSMKRVLSHVWDMRKSAMPIWMYYIHTQIETPRGYNVLDRDFEPDSEIDAYKCSESPLPCRYPCALGGDGKCFNKKLFKS